MENFEFEHPETGEKLWYSRSCAVVGLITRRSESGDVYILATLRGRGTPNNQHKWCLPCGYIDFNESGEDAIIRETFEETGVSIPKKMCRVVGVDTNPKAFAQNITIKYKCDITELNGDFDNHEFQPIDNDEVAEIKWIKATYDPTTHKFGVIGNYVWAFNHDELIKEFGY